MPLYLPLWFACRGDSLREIPFSHGAFLRDNGARERSIIQYTDLLSHWLSLRVIRGTDFSGKVSRFLFPTETLYAEDVGGSGQAPIQ